MKKLTLMALVAVLIFSGCGKDDAKTCDLNAANVAGSYKVTSVLFNGLEVLNDDNFYPACERDDVYTLNANGTYTYTDAGTVCDPAGDDSGTWSFSGSTLTVDGDDAAVSDFTCSGFKVTFSDPTVNLPIVITFQRQ